MAIVGDARMFVYVAVLAVGLLSGAMSQYFYPGNPFSPVHAGAGVVATALIFIWYRLDTDRLGYHRSPYLSIAVVALALLALPYYFFRSRGFRRGLAALGIFIVSILLYSVLEMVGAFALYYGLQS